MKKIVYEMNEVPKRLFDFYAEAFPLSAFAKLKSRGQLFETYTADVGHLSPWITWPTMHRGVANLDHGLTDLGQDLTHVNKNFPNVFDYLTKNNIKVGVFGSLQSYPLPESLDNFCFYVPDTFAAGSECFPSKLNDFQSFNLSMVRSNGRNVSSGIAVKEASNFLVNAKKLGLTWATAGKLANQVVTEKINKDRIVRRRTSQAEIAFDLYYKQLTETMPDISFFFTNHVASSMHRYWPTLFPKDYEDGKFDAGWLKQWSEEIPHSIKVANFQLDKLIRLCDKKNIELIVASSMGQGAVKEVVPYSKQVLITNIKALFKYLNISEIMWEPRLSMSPRIVVKPLSPNFIELISQLDNIYINGQKITYHFTSTGDIRFEIILVDVEELEVLENGVKLNPYELGIEIVNLQDASGAYAYHIPHGILIKYTPNRAYSKDWRSVSTLDFCPSIIMSFGGDVPNYMKGDSGLFL